MNDSRARKASEREEAKSKDMIIVDIEDDVPGSTARSLHGVETIAGGAGVDLAGR